MPIKWEHLFSNRILARGLQYYRQGRVVELQEEDGICEALVEGERYYTVRIAHSDSRIIGMGCNCPYAKDGHRCKHMAAALYEMEECGFLDGASAVVQVLQRKEIHPFAKPPVAAYHYYNMEKIAESITIYDDIFQKANKLVDEKKVILKTVKEGYRYLMRMHYSGGHTKIIQAEGIYINSSGKSAELKLSATRKELVTAECYTATCYKRIDTAYRYSDSDRYELCEHLTALLILLDRYIEQYDPGDATDGAAQSFLTRYRNRATADRRQKAGGDEAGEKRPVVQLEPRLEVGEYGELAASFKVGKGKGYVVKDIVELVDAVEKSGTFALGKKDQIDFARESFDEVSAKRYAFIAREAKGESLRDHNAGLASRYNSEPGGETIKGTMALYGKRLDDFYELEKNETIPYISKKYRKKTTGEAVLQDKLPKVSLQIDPLHDEDGQFDGISLRGDFPKMIEGIDYQYYFDGANLNRATNDALETLDMLRGSRYSSEVDLNIGRKSLSEFYYRVLPALQEFAQVKIKEQNYIEGFLYPEATFVFFLDADERNVTCDVEARYGDVRSVLLESPAEFRDLQREKEVDDILREYLPYRDPETGTYHCDEDETLIYDLIAGGVNELIAFGEVQATERFKNLTIRKKPQISVGVRMESDLLNLSISSGDLSEEELLELLDSHRRKKKFHRLRNGDFIAADSAALEELSAMLDVMHVSPAEFVKGKTHLPLYRAIYLDRMLEKNDALYAKRDSHFRSLVRNFKTVEDSDYEIPTSLQGIMRNYQEFGFKWLRTIEACGFGGILADDMGLGKTLQVIAVLLAAREEVDVSGAAEAAAGAIEDVENAAPGAAAAPDTSVAPALIVTPASLVYNWREEFAKFAPQLKVCTITGNKAERSEKLAGYAEYDAVITSYDLLKRDVSEYEGKRFAYQIIDEAQYIKNHTTAAAKAVKVIDSRVRFALTGTPIENRLSELWSIFDFLMPGFLYTYDRFRKEMETPIAKNKDEQAMAQLKRMVEPFILRRLKSEVLRDLPDKIEEVHYVAFEKAQQQLYDGQVVQMKEMLASGSDEDFNKNKIRILAEITRIRQICCDPSLCFADYSDGSAKREACMDLIRSAIDGEHKMLVFSQFTSMLELLEGELVEEGIPYFKITGATKKEERMELVRRFNSDDTPVFLISLKAGGTGLNLTGADIVIHYDPWWNLAAQNQATDRAHRIGQEKNVTVYRIIVKNSIEEKILTMQETKKALADEILSGETGGLMTMSREDLLALF